MFSKMIAIGLLLTFICPQTFYGDNTHPIKMYPREGLKSSNFTRIPESRSEGWQTFDHTKVASAQPEWYQEVGDTIKKASSTGKGPLWAQVANYVTASRNANGDAMGGLKMKL